jgi:hypothetical protein
MARKEKAVFASFFHRLFERAKTDRRAIEDFTTEVLAEAIRHDKAPMVRVLREAGLLNGSAEVRAIRPETQVVVERAGRVDLQLQVEQGTGACEIWIEVKINSPESGNQLDTYSRAAAAYQIRLATLSREPLRRDDPAIQALSWQRLWDAAESSRAPYWKDLRSLLKELEMADEYNKPIEASEIAGLIPAYSLLCKAAHVLRAVCDHANQVFPQGQLPAGIRQIREKLAEQFAEKGRFTIHTNSWQDVRVFFGLCPDADRLALSVWIETNKNRTLKERLIRQAEQGGLGSNWVRQPGRDAWEALVSRPHPIDSGIPLDDCVTWLNAKIDELNAAGVLAIIPALREPESWWRYMQAARRELEACPGRHFMNEQEMAAWIEELRSDDDRVERAHAQLNSSAGE